jgi:hypothetical protein
VERYFFDIVGREWSELDFTGRVLAAPNIAYDFAELMALDVGVRRTKQSGGPSMYPVLRGAHSSRFRCERLISLLRR